MWLGMVPSSPSAPGPGTIRVLLVDDHALFRQGIASVLRGLPGYNVVGQASDGIEGVQRAKELSPDVVLMDVNMPRCGGLEATLRLSREVPTARVLILSVSEKDEDLFAAIKFGARGYLLKGSGPQEVLQAVERVAAGEAVFSPAMAVKMLDEFKRREPLPSGPETVELSPREMEVLGLLAAGASNREIASTLVLSENTVKTHLKNILEKLQFKNRSQAAAYAARLGLGK
ncbi:MAG: response regulator transcription factor [Chloroflexi bacterium]|nr:response regulator transcription factor [Chloroflexota bacterium]